MSKSEYSAKKVSGLSVEKLNDSLVLLKKESFNLRFQLALGELTNTSRFSKVRKDIARIKTELSKRTRVGV